MGGVWHKAAVRFSTKHSLLISSAVVVQHLCRSCNGSRCSVPEWLKEVELITVLMSSQDVEVTVRGRVIRRPALQNNNPV